MYRGAVAFLTDLPFDAAHALFTQFDLRLASIEAFPGGSVNSNFRARTSDGASFFLRIYEEQPVAGAEAEAVLLDELALAGVPVAAPLRDARGRAVTTYAGKPVAICPWVSGDILCHARVTPAHCRSVGEALARVHLASPKLSAIAAGRFGVKNLLQRLEDIERRAPEELVRAARLIRSEVETADRQRDPGLPSGLIHGDLFRDNVLWNESRIAALLDFESASRGPFLYDLLVCVLAWCYGEAFLPERVTALLSGYQALRPLTPAELRALPVEATLACLRFATTRITDFSLRAPEGQPPKRDFRRFLARLEAIRGGGLDGAFAEIAGAAPSSKLA